MAGRALIPYEYDDFYFGHRKRLKLGIFNKIYTPYVEHTTLEGLGTLTITAESTADNNNVRVRAKNSSSTLTFELVSLYIETKRTSGSTTLTSEWTQNNWLTESSYNYIESTITTSDRTVFNFLCDNPSHWLGQVHAVFRISYLPSGSTDASKRRYTYYSIWWS